MNTTHPSISFWAKFFNIIELLGVILLLLLAFNFQFLLHELPCPLCLLQRLGFLGVAFSLLLNIRFGQKPSHYALVQLFALFTAFVALRQVALHIVPGTGGYGSAVFGLHMYTWSFIVSMVIVILTAIDMGVDRQYIHPKIILKRWHRLSYILFAVTLFLCIANMVSVLNECGLKQCPDNPTHYLLSGNWQIFAQNTHIV